ncbi:hypothetical protein Rsub_03466 [Raphidocelis subcapitata]|uniref:Protein transport protein Sec61 subunit beta n=1 Tax=Raphidocelis subcapitata TaxID=307507 RepID=A0A2V0NY18_9CHLO|nr:hypothetical protein Rsub_03466 [Raphidocelis subcapitata]|eukprot:GBF90470.1 hypothetical protein Rsub_03466 [Raphidocelis subcapitata]
MVASSQTSQAVSRGGRPGSSGNASGAGLRPRRPVARVAGGGKPASAMNYYTDDSPGLKLQPVWVIVMSLAFILFVTVCHVVGKLAS